jgi:hypothetical protein
VTARFAPHLSRSPALQTALAGYTQRLDLEDRAATLKEEQKRERRNERISTDFGRANQILAAGGGAAEIEPIFQQDGKLTKREQDFLTDVKTGTSIRDRRTAEATKAAAAQGQANAEAKTRDERHEKFGEFLGGIKPLSLEDAIANLPQTPEGAKRAEELRANYTPQINSLDRTRIRAILRHQYGVPEEQLPQNDEELYGFALDTYYGRPYRSQEEGKSNTPSKLLTR